MNETWIAEEYDALGRVLRSVVCGTEQGARNTVAYWARVRGSDVGVFRNGRVTA